MLFISLIFHTVIVAILYVTAQAWQSDVWCPSSERYHLPWLFCRNIASTSWQPWQASITSHTTGGTEHGCNRKTIWYLSWQQRNGFVSLQEHNILWFCLLVSFHDLPSLLYCCQEVWLRAEHQYRSKQTNMRRKNDPVIFCSRNLAEIHIVSKEEWTRAMKSLHPRSSGCNTSTVYCDLSGPQRSESRDL